MKMSLCNKALSQCAAELFAFIFQKQFPALNEKKYLYLWDIDISHIELFD